MKEIGRMEPKMVKENLFGEMVANTKVTLQMIKLKVLVNTNGPMVTFILENGIKMKNMVKEHL